jgi:RND family efflux transporter MFP subunit
MSELHAVIHLPESEKAELKADQKAFVKVASSEVPFEGHIERISPIVDKDTGTIRVTVSVSPEQGNLRPGMFTKVGVIYDSHTDTMLIPKQALLTQDNASYVFIVEDGVAHKKQVATGFVNSHQIEITDGLSTNDLVITMGQRNLRDQTQVEVIEAVADL